MKYLTAVAGLLLFTSGCSLLQMDQGGGGGDSFARRKHGGGGDDAPVPRTVEAQMDKRVPEVKTGHPKLLFTDREIPTIMEAIHRDPTLEEKYTLLLHQGEKMLKDPPTEYVEDNEKAVTAARQVLSRVSTLAGLYRLTGEKRFAERAKDEMLAVAAYPDWHTNDFLPTAELLNSLGLGYDWLYNYLDPRDRETIHNAIIRQGLKPAQYAYQHGDGWTYTLSNHNPVGNGGVAVGAVAVADEDPELAKQLISVTRKSLPPAMDQYGPDGAWPEGPIYWDYATKYASFYMAALDAGLGTDFGAGSYPGLAETGMFRIHSTGPTKKTFNFGDAEEICHPASFMFYLAKRFDKPIYASHEQYVSLPEANLFEVIWRARYGPIEPFEQLAEKTLPRDAVFRGVDVAFLRGDWEDPNATWVGVKAGTNEGPHRHLDLGSFVMDALGQRWALDLGPDSYNLPGYNGSDKRWTYYRCETQGHNTLTINGPNQETSGDSKMVAFHSSPTRSYAVVDMTNAYANAKRVVRGVAMLNRRDVVVVDEIEMGKPSRITWNFHTRAHVEAEGDHATLTLGGKTLEATILSPAGAKFEAISAKSAPPQEQQPDVTNLVVHLPDLAAHTRIIVMLSPDLRAERVMRGEEPGAEPRQESPREVRATPKLEALDDWIAGGKIPKWK